MTVNWWIIFGNISAFYTLVLIKSFCDALVISI